MKNAFLIFLLTLMAILPGQGAGIQVNRFPGLWMNEDTITVYYFHYTRRCATCQAVEDESRMALETLYPELVKSGKIAFESLNIEEPSGESLAEELEISGQALVVIKGGKRIDLTDEGFLYARTNPDKLREKIKSAIDPLL